ncbi:MAG: rane-bound metallopeptidase [Bacteroidetes bacterium]|jgi:septal ring factor EnvC (AmiA/AmiB activator)|nr:rane-bound metallopeptidase [Bacteroidota bacterium]MDF2452308.1 rane-bound metallopeptidase [Bacteroidota bacterium]
MIRFLLKKKNNSICICVLFFFISVSNPLFAQTKGQPSQKDLLNKKNKLNDDIKQLNSQLSQTKANKKSQINTIVVINTKIKVREELISTINAELAQINSRIKKNVTEVNALMASLEKLKSEYAKMIYFAQRNQDSYTKIMFLFSSGNFNQAYMRIKYFQQYAAFRKKQANEIIATQVILNDKLKELEGQRHEKNVLLGNEKEEKTQLDGEKQQQEIVLSELQQQEKELKEELEKKKKDAENLQIAIKRLIEAEIKRKMEESAKIAAEKAAKAAKAEKNKTKPKTKAKTDVKTPETRPTAPELTEEAEALGADFASSRGKLPWPVTKGVICQPYGEYEHPAIKGFMMNNNGVEICANKGSQARTVFEGEVTSIAISPTGGKLIIIRHGEYLSVYSNIGEVFVKQGDKVSIKQNIGTILDEDGKTSMNLQIWKGQRTMDPSGWLFNAR